VKRGVIIVRRKTRFLVAAMVAACLMLPVAALGTAAQTNRQWTVLLYFGADNDLYQATYFCINQTLKGLDIAEADSNDLAVVVLFDGPESEDTKLWELTYDGVPGVTEDDIVDLTGMLPGKHERAMTDPDTLIEFLTKIMVLPDYEALKTMLVVKNGHAWCGICPDATDNPGNEKILMPIEGVRDALSDAHEETGKWVDVVTFDGDNMGSIEVAYELRTVTSYMIGSQQQVPLEGLPYCLFMQDLAGDPGLNVEAAGETLIDDYIRYYNNTEGKGKQIYDKLLANSQMYVTAAMFEMGEPDAELERGWKIAAVVDAFNAYLNYMLYGTYPQELIETAVEEDGRITYSELDEKHDQWYYTDPETDDTFWAWIPLNRNNIASARDCSLIGKMNDQQGYEWLPDVFTWLWSMSALTNYDAYLDAVYVGGRPIEDVDPKPLNELVDPFVRLLLEDFMLKFGYEELGIYRGLFNPEMISGDGALVYLNQSKILDRSGNSFPHGLNIWFPPSPLQWDEGDEWSDLFNKPMTYSYWGIVFAYDGDEPVYLPAEYYCIDCPDVYYNIGLDFTLDTDWMPFFDMYYDSRWLIYGSDTGGRE